VNSISYLAVLDTLLNSGDANPAVPRDSLLDYVLKFFMKFNGRQIRYLGTSFTGIVEQIAAGKIFPVGGMRSKLWVGSPANVEYLG
jgi:hypothetical protein